MVKLEKKFREFSWKKGQGPEIRITQLEDLCVKLDNMGFCINKNQFVDQSLNNLTSNCDLEFGLMERRVGDADKPLTIEEIRGRLNFTYDRLIMKTSRDEECDCLKNKLLSGGNSRETVKSWSNSSGTNYC
jgi:hypothetical protein